MINTLVTKARSIRLALAWAMLWIVLPTVCVAAEPSPVFYCSFDSAQAEVAPGDGRLQTSANLKREQVAPGLCSVAEFIDDGRFGKAVRFRDIGTEVLMFKGKGNYPYSTDRHDVSIVFWLRVDPEKGLKPGYVDPLQITDKKWDDASLFVDFSAEDKPRHFRFGAFSDFKHWNPENTKWETVTEQQRPLISHKKLAFAGDRWTHVAMTLQNVNSGKGDGVAKLFLDGELIGEMKRNFKFTWNPDKLAIMLGIQYIGDIDDFAIFNQCLDAKQIQTIVGSNQPLK